VRFPSKPEELDLHERVLGGDPLAPTDIFGAFVDPLAAVLRSELGCRDEELMYDAAVDAVFAYLDAPEVYDRDRARLSTFLRRIATVRLVDRLRSTSRRREREENFRASVELRAEAPNVVMERAIEARELSKYVEAALPDGRDQEALKLILAGEGHTVRLAAVLGLGGLPADEQKLAVKRHRDRILKVLERMGEALDDDDP